MHSVSVCAESELYIIVYSAARCLESGVKYHSPGVLDNNPAKIRNKLKMSTCVAEMTQKKHCKS